MQVRLVSFEAGNITRYMFVTGRRREIAGASELITYLDRVWVNRALEDLWEGFSPSWMVEDRPVELLFTGAGRAAVLVRDGEPARQLVSAVTRSALREAPGLDVYGTVGEPFDWDSDGKGLHRACGAAVGGLEDARTERPSSEARFARLPLTDSCASTGLPAQGMVEHPDGGLVPRSAEGTAKWRAYGRTGDGAGLTRLAGLAGTDPDGLRKSVDRLNESYDWVGVVYVDGNGLGRVFHDFTSCVPGPGNRVYADTLREFTDGLDACAQQAFAKARTVTEAQVPYGAGADAAAGSDSASGGAAPVLPLILGGDDVVVMCSGAWALPFTRAYLESYERLTAAHGAVAAVLNRAGRAGRVTASAGVAIVKSHFPYVAAAGLAADLLGEAKVVKEAVPPEEACSAVAFHVLYDSSGADLSRIRSGTGATAGTGPDCDARGGVSLVAQPYVIGDRGPVNEWARGRRWADLEKRVHALRDEDEDGERRLPTAQMHRLREGLFAGQAVADVRYRSMLRRYNGTHLESLAGDSGSLYWDEPSGRRVTGLLDAMAAVPFLPAKEL